MATKKTKTVKMGNLLLDPHNARIPTVNQTADQRALLHELVAHEDILGLAKSIASLGLFPNERMIVMPHGRNYLVLEGNRRLAAIKLLVNPELAQTSSMVGNFRRLARNIDLTPLMSVDVFIVQDRLAAARFIAALHTRPARKPWRPVQKGQYYRYLVDTGLTPRDLAQEIGVQEGEVRRSLRSEIIYRIAQTLDLTPDVRKRLASRKFSYTTLERFLERTAGQAFLGIKPDNTHGVRGVVHPDRFRAVLTTIVTDIATQSGLTRAINTEAEMRTYINKAEQGVPATKKRGSFTPDSFLGGDDPRPEPPVAPTKPRRKRRRSTSVIPRDFECNVHEPKVNALFGELKNINVRTQRNSSGVMLRVLLDVALWCFYKRTSLDTTVINHYDNKRKNRRHNSKWTPSLRELLSYGIDNTIFPGMSADEYKSLRTLLAKDANWIATIDILNEYTHNPQVQPTEQEVQTVWERVEPLFKIILR